MAALERIRFVPFAVPPSNPPFCNRNTLAHDQPSRSIRSLNTSGGQKIRKSADPLSRSGYQADRNEAARAQDDHFPSLEELSRAALSSKISTEASKTGCTLQRLEQPAVHSVGLQVNPTQSGLGERQGICQDQPVILDDNGADNAGVGNEVEGAFRDIDTGHIGRNASPHIAASSELVLTPTQSINTSGPWYDVEETYYVNEPVPGPRPHEQHGVPATLAQSQLQTVPRSSTPLQDQISQQDIDNITQSTSMESAPRSLPKPSDNGNDGWTDDSMAELEKELGLALEELQVESSSAGTPTSPSPRSAEAPPDEIQSRECTKTTSSRPEELQDTSRNDTAQVLEEWELQETEVVVEGGPVAMQQQKELGDPDVGDQNLVEVVDADDLEDKEVTEILLNAEPTPDEHRFRLRGIRTRSLAGRQTKTTQYCIAWRDRLNRSAFWFNEGDVQFLMLRPPCEQSSQDVVPPVEKHVMRILRMRRRNCRKGKKLIEYLVDKSRWITEDQLTVTLSPESEPSSPYPLSQAQREFILRHSTTPIGHEHYHASRACTPADPPPVDEPPTRKRGYQEAHTEISSETHHSANTNNNHNTCDTEDEDPRPPKRRRSRAIPAATLEVDVAQPQVDYVYPSESIDTSDPCVSWTPRSPSSTAETAAECQQVPLRGFLKCTTSGKDTVFNLEFHLVNAAGGLDLPSPFKWLGNSLGVGLSEPVRGVSCGTVAHSKKPHMSRSPRYESPVITETAISHRVGTKRRAGKELTETQEALLVYLVQRDKTWPEIGRRFPEHTLQSLKENYFTKQGGQPRRRGRKAGVKVVRV